MNGIGAWFGELAGMARGTSLVFEGLPPGWFVLLALFGAASAFLLYRLSGRELARPRRLALVALRSLGFLCLLLFLADPSLELRRETPVRSSLLVLVDNSRSMRIRDERPLPGDRSAAASLAGQETPERRELVAALAENRSLDLFGKLGEVADLKLISFGGSSRDLTELKPGSEAREAAETFRRLAFDEESTGLGEALDAAANEWRGSPLAGIFLVSDGASNAGRDPLDGAKGLVAEKLPVFAYGTGVAETKDLQLVGATAPSVGFLKERVEVRGLIRLRGYPAGTEARVVLQAGGKEVASKKVTLAAGTSDVALDFTPSEAGDHEVALAVEPLPGEGEAANNRAVTKLRVVDQKVRLLYIEQEPRWDFRYITNALKDDRRVGLSCHVLFGERGMAGEEYAHFLDKLPEPSELMRYQVILLGDVDPAALGAARIEAIERMVGETGAGLIFLAGSRFNPLGYRGTPLAGLLPVDLVAPADPANYASRSREPIRLLLGPSGAASPMLALAEEEAGTRKIWEGFPGVRWFSSAAQPKPTAETLVVSASGVPVIATQSYGRGQTLYFGTDETYRWRSGVGGEHFVRLWTQIIQSFALERLAGASDLVQLRPARPAVFSGEPVEISGRVFDAAFRPLQEAQIEGEISREEGGMEPQRVRFGLSGNTPGLYAGRWTAPSPGSYRFVPLIDRSAIIRFDVMPRDAELMNPSMERETLESLAAQTGGRFLAEADLPLLPGLVEASGATVSRTERIPIARHGFLILLAAALFLAEWTLRRLSALK